MLVGFDPSIQSIVGIIWRSDCSLIYYIFIYLAFLSDVFTLPYFHGSSVRGFKKSMLDVFSRTTLNLKNRIDEGNNQTRREAYLLMRR